MKRKKKLCNNFLDTSRQLHGISPNHLRNFLPTLEQHESRHGTHAQLGRRRGQLVDVDLVELGLREVLAELGNLGRDGLARAAPRREAVEDDCVLRLGDLFLELGVPFSISIFFILVGQVHR